MIDSSSYLTFTNEGRTVGTDVYGYLGNALLNKEVKDIIIPEKHQGHKVTTIGKCAFRSTNITSIFLSKYIKNILWASFWDCKYLKYITFDFHSELEYIDVDVFGSTIIESINIPASLKNYSIRNNIFAVNSLLKCVSYLGKTNLSLTRFLYSSPSTLVAPTLPEYEYKVGIYEATKDSQRCPEKIFPIQLKELIIICTRIRKQDIFLLKQMQMMILLMV